ncbi:hypothetical protein PMAYCL1PPCAC_19597 [Pristionchus mayeri]|uniref:Uncharacterized protein n=1 Tax=Pristionchus mayeri TaxID=1317129 RepID=A0AAN5CSK0_9BILA|nr:hypothetical protein PMAYCL1PPCAC_19597 [Pristionchus mayeri]
MIAQSGEVSARMREDLENQLRMEREHYEDYCSRWNSQMENLIMMMKKKQWNRKMEDKWTDRLDGLRQFLIAIRHQFNNLRFELDDMMKSGRFHLTAKDKSEIEMNVRILHEKLAEMQGAMENEVEDMKRMEEEHPEASFLIDIEESAKEVGEAAAEMTKNLQIFIEGMKERSGVNTWNGCVKSFENLEQKVALIPTVKGLKEKRMQEDSEENIDQSVVVSSLQITELE